MKTNANRDCFIARNQVKRNQPAIRNQFIPAPEVLPKIVNVPTIVYDPIFGAKMSLTPITIKIQ